MKHYPVVLICDENPDALRDDEKYFSEIKDAKGIPVTIVRATSPEDLEQKMHELVEQGNYADVIYMNGDMRASHVQMIQQIESIHAEARAAGKIQKTLPYNTKIYFPYPAFETHEEAMADINAHLGQVQATFSGDDERLLYPQRSYDKYVVDDISIDLEDLYKDIHRRQAIEWHEKEVTNKPVVVICNDDLRNLGNRQRHLHNAWGDNVEVVLVSNYMGFIGQMNKLIESGNFPDYITIDASFGKEANRMIEYMASSYVAAKKAGKIDKPWPTHLYVDSACTDSAREKIPDLQYLGEKLPKQIQDNYNVELGHFEPQRHIAEVLRGMYPSLKPAPEDSYLSPSSLRLVSADQDAPVVRSHLEYFYNDHVPAMAAAGARQYEGDDEDFESEDGDFAEAADTSIQIGRLQSEGGFGGVASGYIAYTLEDIERIERKRQSSSSVYSQDTILVVREFKEREHGPLLPRIRGIVICEGVFEPHIQISLQNFGISALAGADFDEFQRVFPATYEDFNGTELSEVVLDPDRKLFYVGHEVAGSASLPTSTARLVSSIGNSLKGSLSVEIKYQAEHYTQARPASPGLKGIGLIRSESLVRGDMDHYDAAVAVIASAGDEDDKVIAWQSAQRKSFEQIVKLASMWEPVCFRLADFGSGDFLPKQQVEKVQAQLNTVLLPQGVQLAKEKPHIYKGQLRAAFKVAHDIGMDKLEILIPQVETADDVSFVRKLVAEVLAEKDQPNPQSGFTDIQPRRVRRVQAQSTDEQHVLEYTIGSMIETNDALENIEEINKISDFMCVGMNDVVRVNQPVSRLWHSRQDAVKAHGFDPYIQVPQPILGKVAHAVAKVKGADMRLCGEFASQVDGILFAHENGFKAVVVTPNHKSTDVNPQIAREISWRRNQGTEGVARVADPVMALAGELKLNY